MNRYYFSFRSIRSVLLLNLFLFSVQGQSLVEWDIGDGRGNGGDGIYLCQNNELNQLEPCDQSNADQIWLYDFFELFFLLNQNNQLSINDFTFFNQNLLVSESESRQDQAKNHVINQLNQWSFHGDKMSQSLAKVLLAILHKSSPWEFDSSTPSRNNLDTRPLIENSDSSLLKCATSNSDFDIKIYNQCFDSELIENPFQLSGLISHEIIYILFSKITNNKALDLVELSSNQNKQYIHLNQKDVNATQTFILDIINHVNYTLGLDPDYSNQQSLIVRIINQALYYQGENSFSMMDVIKIITNEYKK